MGRQNLNHWTTREVPEMSLFKLEVYYIMYYREKKKAEILWIFMNWIFMDFHELK